MIRRPPRSTLFPYHDALPIYEMYRTQYAEIAAGQYVLISVSDNGSGMTPDRKSTRLNSSHQIISYAVFCLKKKKSKHTNAASDINSLRSTVNLSPPIHTSMTN